VLTGDDAIAQLLEVAGSRRLAQIAQLFLVGQLRTA